MSTRDWFLFVTTFVMAVLCGMWLYFTTFIPTYVANPVVNEIAEQVAPEWTLAARLYGGCAMVSACPAYELTSQGRYRYQPTPAAAVETGRLPRSLRDQYDAILTETASTQWAAAAVEQNCRSYVDGVDFAYVFTSADTYTFDTCSTNLPYDSRLVAVTEETLRYLDNPEQYQPATPAAPGRSGLSGYLERLLDKTFDYDAE